MSAPPWVLVYGAGKGGRTTVERDGEAYDLDVHTTLMGAYIAALREGYEPTRWRSEDSSVLMRIDQAKHWRSLMERGVS
jgi:hypothetical protein